MSVNGIGAIDSQYGFFACYLIAGSIFIFTNTILFLSSANKFIKLAPKKTAFKDFLKILLLSSKHTKNGFINVASIIGIYVSIILSIIPPFLEESIFQTILTYFVGIIFVTSWLSIVLINRNPKYIYEAEKYMDKTEKSNKIINDGYMFLRIWPIIFIATILWLVISEMTSSIYSIACQCNLLIFNTQNQFNGNIVSVGNPLPVVIMVPIMSKYIYPFLEKLCGREIKILNRITIGLVFCGLAMISTAVIEIIRKHRPLLIDSAPSSCASKGVMMSDHSLWWLLIPNILTGIAEVFICVPVYEICYREVPEGMRSTAQSMTM